MSQDAKNSILLWVGTLALCGVGWLLFRYDIELPIPERWRMPLLGIVIGLNALKLAWDYFRKRNSHAEVRDMTKS